MAFAKDDRKDGKVDLTIFPMDALEGISRILEMGAAKYSRDNWREGCDDPDAQRRITGAMLRHYAALQRGETIDPESGESHVLHMACNAVFLAAFSETHRRRALDFARAGARIREALARDRSAVEGQSGMSAEEANEEAGCGTLGCQVCY